MRTGEGRESIANTNEGNLQQAACHVIGHTIAARDAANELRKSYTMDLIGARAGRRRRRPHNGTSATVPSENFRPTWLSYHTESNYAAESGLQVYYKHPRNASSGTFRYVIVCCVGGIDKRVTRVCIQHILSMKYTQSTTQFADYFAKSVI